MFGKSARFELGVDHIAIGYHVEYPAATGHQLCIAPQDPLDFIRQTGGSRFVVSFCAVVNFDLHFLSPVLLYYEGTAVIFAPRRFCKVPAEALRRLS